MWSTADIQINEDMVCTVEFPDNFIVCRLVIRIEPGVYLANFQTFIKYPLEPGIVWSRETFTLFGIYGIDIVHSILQEKKGFNSHSELAIEMAGSIVRPFWSKPDVERFKAKFLCDPYLPSLDEDDRSNLIRLLKYLET